MKIESTEGPRRTEPSNFHFVIPNLAMPRFPGRKEPIAGATRFDDARADAVQAAIKAGDDALAARIKALQFRDIRPKPASEMDLGHASKLLGHTEHEITEKVYRRVGETIKPTR